MTVRRHRIVGAMVAAGWLALHPAPARAQALQVFAAGDHLTIKALDAPLAAVIAAAARQIGARVEGLDQISGTVTLAIDDKPILQAFATLLNGRNYIITGVGADTDGPASPIVVRVYPAPKKPVGAAAAAATASTAASDPAPIPDDGLGSPTNKNEADVARLTALGFFNADASSGPLLNLAATGGVDARARALHTLTVQHAKGAEQALRQALNDEDPGVRSDALTFLLGLGGTEKEKMQRLAELSEHENPAVRLAAINALGDASGSDVDFRLRRALDDADPVVKAAAEALLKQREKKDKK